MLKRFMLLTVMPITILWLIAHAWQARKEKKNLTPLTILDEDWQDWLDSLDGKAQQN